MVGRLFGGYFRAVYLMRALWRKERLPWRSGNSAECGWAADLQIGEKRDRQAHDQSVRQRMPSGIYPFQERANFNCELSLMQVHDRRPVHHKPHPTKVRQRGSLDGCFRGADLTIRQETKPMDKAGGQ